MAQSNKKNILEKALHFSRTHFWVLPALFFVTSIFAVNVNAQVIQSSPSRMNLFGIGDPDYYEAAYQCRVAPTEGFFGSALDFVQKLTSGKDAADFLCLKQRKAKGIVDNPNGGTGLFRDYFQPGLNDYVNLANAMVLNERPASGTGYVEQQVYALANPGRVSAQEPSYYYPGTGFSLQKPVQSFWGWSVNVTYGFLVILIIIIAFAIMFRSKLGGAASITLQSAIPNIAIAMILVPLSYAITGVFIDVVTLGTNVAHEFIMGPGSPARNVYDLRNDTNQDGDVDGSDNGAVINLPVLKDVPVEDRGLYADDVRVSWYGIFSTIDLTKEIDALVDVEDNPGGVLGIISKINDILGQGDSGLDTWIAEIINSVVSLVIFLTGLRIFALLIKKYITFLLNPIFSPFVFATIAIPGTGTKNIMTFLKQLWAASLFFIISYTMSLLSIVLTSQSFLSTIPNSETSGYIPPGLGLNGLFSGTGVSNDILSLVLAIAGIGVYLRIPKTLKDMDAKLGTDKSALMPILNDTMTSWRQSVGVGRVLARSPGTVADSIDKARGKTPGEYGTLRGFTRRGTSDIRQSLNTVAQRGGIVGAAAGAAGGLVGGASRIAGSNRAGSFDSSKENVLKVGIKMGAADVGGGFLGLTDKQLLQLIRRGGGSGTSPVMVAELFKLTFEAENFQLPTKITQIKALGEVPKRGTADTEAGAIQSASLHGWDALLPTRSGLPLDGIDVFNLSGFIDNMKSKGIFPASIDSDLIKFYPAQSGPFDSNGKSSAVKMNLWVKNPKQLEELISFGVSIVGEVRFFEINGVVSKNNTRFAVQTTPGNN